MTTETIQNSEIELLRHIADTLNEGNITLIQKVIEVIGPERTQEFLQKALEIEAAGGMMTTDSSRRRSPGGAFFYTVRTGLPKEERKRIWPNPSKKRKRAASQDDSPSIVEKSTGAD